MSSLFDFDRQEQRYAVMGNPVAHSKSPLIHTAFARQFGLKIGYTAIQVDAGGFPQAVGNFQAAGGKGLNITVPFKREAWLLSDVRTARAELAGAVNTLSLKPDGGRHGDNTDGIGLVRDILQNHAGRISGQRVLLLGAGGAVRGVLGPLLEERPAQLTIVNRDVEKARELIEVFAGVGKIEMCPYAQLQDRQFDLIINGTSASLSGELPPLPGGILAKDGWCYDMMYAAEPTAFVRWGEGQGAATSLDGLGMLVEQAAESFFIWHGVRPDTAPVIKEIQSLMYAR